MFHIAASLLLADQLLVHILVQERISCRYCLVLVFLVVLVEATSLKQPKAPTFQTGSG